MQKDKRIEGVVSLWVGVSPSQGALEDYVEIDYPTNDLSKISQFADDFGTRWHDEDFMEFAAGNRRGP